MYLWVSLGQMKGGDKEGEKRKRGRVGGLADKKISDGREGVR